MMAIDPPSAPPCPPPGQNGDCTSDAAICYWLSGDSPPLDVLFLKRCTKTPLGLKSLGILIFCLLFMTSNE